MSCSENRAYRARAARLVWTIATVFAFGLSAAAAAEEMAVVTAAKGPIVTLERDTAEQLYLGRRSVLADGQPVQLLDLPAGPERDRFYQLLTGKRPSQIRAYWSRLVFTGRALPPREVASIDDVRRILLENPGTVGYLPAAPAADPALRVLLRLE